MKLSVIESDNAQKPWYADGLKFTCACCGNCCTGGPGFVWISRDEIARLAALLKLSLKETIRRHCRKIGRRYSLKEHRNSRGQYDCEFLKEIPGESRNGEVALARRICTIYDARPLQCRTWPFWDGIIHSKDQWDAAAQHCHGMNHGRKFRYGEIVKLRDATDWPDRPPTSAKARRSRREGEAPAEPRI